MLRFDSYVQAPSNPGGNMRDVIEVYWDARLLFEYNRVWHIVLLFACLFGALILYGTIR